MPTSVSRVISNYLYGSNQPPENFTGESLIRDSSEITEIDINAVDHMANEGRFATGATSEIVFEFFEADSTTLAALFDTYSGGSDELRFSKNEWAQDVLGLSFFGIAIDHKDYRDGNDDFAERVYIFGNQTYAIADEAEFVIDRNTAQDGTVSYERRIDNFAVVPWNNPNPANAENFDLESSDFTTELTSAVSEAAIDPSGIGRRVNFNFTDTDDVARLTYFEADYISDRADDSANKSLFELSPAKAIALAFGAADIFDAAFSSGVTRTLDEDGRPIIYGTNANDEFEGTVTPNGVSISDPSVKTFDTYLYQFLPNGLVYVGGAGGDTFRLAPREEIVYGGSDDDVVIASAGSDILFGGMDNDTLRYDAGFGNLEVSIAAPASGDARTVFAVAAGSSWTDLVTEFESITLSGLDERLIINDAAVVTALESEGITISGEAGIDTLDFSGANSANTIELEPDAGPFIGFENIIGSAFDDVMNGSNPSDTASVVTVSMSSDTNASNGSNTLEGGAGDDQIDGLGGEDVLRGMAGEDVINGGPPVGANGNEAADRIEGGSGNDVISIHAGEAYGQGDDDLIAIFGDVADGPDGEDDPAVRAFGGSGNDTLDARGSSGSHILSGGSGSDTLYGNGNSVLSGGSGADEFYMTAGDTILEAEAHDKLFYNGVEILDDGNDILWGWEIGPRFGRAYIPIQQNGEGLRSEDNPFVRRALDEDIAIVFEITGLDADFNGTADGVIHKLHIFENVQFDEIGTFGVPPLDQQFRLRDAVATIEDWRPGDFGLFPTGLVNTTHDGPMANSLDLQERLTLDGTYYPLGGIDNGPARFLSKEAKEAEATQEKLTEELSDEWLSVSGDNSGASGTEAPDYFFGDGPSTSGGGGSDQFVLNASANVASGGADGDLMVGLDGNDTLGGDGGNDQIYGNSAPGAALFSPFVGFGDAPTVPELPDIPFDPPADDYERGYNDGFFAGFTGEGDPPGEPGELGEPGGELDELPDIPPDELEDPDGPLPDLPGNDYEFGYFDGYADGQEAAQGGEEEPEPPLASDDDNLFGGAGDDTIYGGRGADLIEGNEDDDLLFGEVGDDTLLGDEGTDTLEGGDGNDSLSGGEGADEVSGGAGNDTVSGDAGDDVVSGNQGNDEVSGGAGADTVSGGSGNDLILGGEGDDSIDAASGDDSIYGGLGDDSIRGGVGDDTYFYARGDGSDSILDTGPFAYLNTDRIVFTDIASTEVQYRQDGDDFIILLSDGARITSVSQFRLGNADIEFIDFADNVTVEISEGIVEEAVVSSETTDFDDGRVLETTFVDGVKTTATMTDVDNAYAWESYTDTFDLDGNRTSRDTTYDDGRQAQNAYVDGVLASSLVTDVADSFVWNTVDRDYDANGVQTRQTNTYDDGRVLETTYVNGVRASAVMTDPTNAYLWTSYTDSFDANGDLLLRTITYDDGRVTETTSSGGLTTSSLITDIDNAYAWDTIERGYDAEGMQISQINTYDDGRVLNNDLIDGVRSTGAMTDVADAYAWASYNDTFDGEGALVTRSMVYDDGRIAETAYIAGVREENSITDAGDAYVWSSVERLYDLAGSQVAQVTTYDDGRVLEATFVDGVQTTASMTDPADVYAWASYVDTFDATGARISRNTTYDDGRETLNSYVGEGLVSSFTTDVADQFVWETVEKTYDAGNVLTEQTTDYDNGRLLETIYVNGIRSTATMTDVDDVYTWSNYVDTFDTNGDLATRLMTFDDGREVFTDYLA